MWSLQSVEVINPTGLITCESLDWNHGVRFFGPHRELMFVGICKKVLSPEMDVVFNFNPRAQLFRTLSNVLNLSESLISLTDVETDEAKIGSWLRGGHVPIAGRTFADNLLVVLRAEVMYLFGTICAIHGRNSRDQLSKVFDHLASINGQNDELLPLMVETVMGSEFRRIFENLCGNYYFQSAQGKSKRREWLFHAEKLLTEICSQPLNVKWDLAQRETMHTKSLDSHPLSGDESCVFLPFCSSHYEMEKTVSLPVVCTQLVSEGVRQFFCVESFHEQLRWVDHLSFARQEVRVNAVREDPLRRQSFFDARTGRQKILLLSDASLSFLRDLLEKHPIADFTMQNQDTIETAFEVNAIRERFERRIDPQFDQLILAKALFAAGRSKDEMELFLSVEGMQRVLESVRLEQGMFVKP